MCIFWQLVVEKITQGGWNGGVTEWEKAYIIFFFFLSKRLTEKEKAYSRKTSVHRRGSIINSTEKTVPVAYTKNSTKQSKKQRGYFIFQRKINRDSSYHI